MIKFWLAKKLVEILLVLIVGIVAMLFVPILIHILGKEKDSE